jgi:hypothetical protein
MRSVLTQALLAELWLDSSGCPTAGTWAGPAEAAATISPSAVSVGGGVGSTGSGGPGRVEMQLKLFSPVVRLL